MKQKLLQLGFISCLLMITGCTHVFAVETKKPECRIWLKIAHKSYLAGQPIQLHIFLRNLSNHAVSVYAYQYSLAGLKLNVVNQNDNVVPLTRLGKTVFEIPTEVSQLLPPIDVGETDQFATCLSQLFDLSRPGRYTLSCTGYRGPLVPMHWRVFYSTNLHFTVFQKQKYVNGITTYTQPSKSRRYIYGCSPDSKSQINSPLISRFECNSHGPPAWCIQNNSKFGDKNTWEYVSPNKKYLYVGSYYEECIYQYRILNYGHLKPLDPLIPAQMKKFHSTPIFRGNDLIYAHWLRQTTVYHISANGQLRIDEAASKAIPSRSSTRKLLSDWVSNSSLSNGSNVSALPLDTLISNSTHTAFVNSDFLITFRVLPNKTIYPLLQPLLTKELGTKYIINFMKIDKPAHLLIMGISVNTTPESAESVEVEHLVSLRIQPSGLLKLVSNLELHVPMPGSLPYQITKIFINSSGKYLLTVSNLSRAIVLYRIAADGKLIMAENWTKMENDQSPYLWSLNHLYCDIKFHLSDITVSKEGRLVIRPFIYPFSNNTYDIDALATAVVPAPPVWNTFSDGLAVSLRMNPHTYLVGSPIEMTVRLKNQSNTPVRLGNRASGKCAIQLQITRGRAIDSGNMVAINEPLSSIDNPLGAGVALQNAATSPLGLITLQPHQHLEVHFYINTLADCTIGGNYYVSVCMNDATDHPMISRVEKIRVISTTPIKVTSYLRNSGVVIPHPEPISSGTSPMH